MGIGNKINEMANQVQDGVKTSSVSILALIVKLVTAFFFGLTMALIAQEMIRFGTISFVAIMIVASGLIYKMMQKWSLGSTLLFDLICVLVALLLRMYILLAP